MFPESDSINGVWDVAAEGEDFDHYFVYVENEDMDDTTLVVHYTWKGLEACTNYTLGVKAVTSKGDMSEPALQAAQTLVGSKLLHTSFITLFLSLHSTSLLCLLPFLSLIVNLITLFAHIITIF